MNVYNSQWNNKKQGILETSGINLGTSSHFQLRNNFWNVSARPNNRPLRFCHYGTGTGSQWAYLNEKVKQSECE